MYLKIVSVVFLIAIVVDVHGTETSSDRTRECFEKFNINEDFLASLNFGNLSKEQKERISCNIGCITKIDSVKKGQTLYQYLETYISKGYHDVAVLDAMRQTLSPCADVGDDECKLMECIDLFSPPWKVLTDGLVEFINTHKPSKVEK